MEQMGSGMIPSVHPAVTCHPGGPSRALCLSSGGCSLVEEHACSLRGAEEGSHGADDPQAVRDGNPWVNTWASLPLEEAYAIQPSRRISVGLYPLVSSKNPLGNRPALLLPLLASCLTSSLSFLGSPPKSTTCPKFFPQGCVYECSP